MYLRLFMYIEALIFCVSPFCIDYYVSKLFVGASRGEASSNEPIKPSENAHGEFS